MLIIEQAALANGAHRSQRGAKVVPDGWLPVLPSIEEEALGYLPFIVIDKVERGYIIVVSQGTIPPTEPEPEPEPTDTEVLNTLLGVTE